MSEKPINKIGAGLVGVGLMGLLGIASYAARDVEIDWDKLASMPEPIELDPEIIREQNRFEELKRIESRITDLQWQHDRELNWMRRSDINKEIAKLKVEQRNLLKPTTHPSDGMSRDDLEIMKEQNRFNENKRIEDRITDLVNQSLTGNLDWFVKQQYEAEIAKLRLHQIRINQR